MGRLRLAAVLLAVLAIAPAAGHADVATPTGLHAFLLRPDERAPAGQAFNRTPAFAWNPVPGAVGYEFQLSISDTFRDSGVIYDDAKLTGPVAAPRLSLPWITGSPHFLYARVRAVAADGAGQWSDGYGFDMSAPSPPRPLPSAPGLLRWTPVPGADAYEIWLIDANKFEFSYTNVLDEREFYTFHQAPSWTGTIRWRIRAVRNIVDNTANRIPTSFYGAWSDVYTSTNPPVTTGPIVVTGTYSDVVGDASSSAPAHRLMPAFVWSGNQTDDGTAAELFRVYIFTDKTCLNRVYTSPVIGSQAYSPRPFGPLALPTSEAGLGAARGQYLADAATEGAGFTDDGEPVTTNESAASASTTVALPTAGGSIGAPAVTWSPDSKFGAPVDLWDTNWPQGGYYWTVIPVAAISPGSLATTAISPGAQADATSLPVASTAGFNVGDIVNVGFKGSANFEQGLTITSTTGGQLGFAAALKFAHGGGEPITRTGGNLQYVDLESASDVCQKDPQRVARFGKDSEPTLTSAGEPFAAGLSSAGKLTSAPNTDSFYGHPLVAWTPALGASVYEVQWSKTKYPFTPEADPATQTLGILTSATAAVLPLDPGTWYYRVRGFDYLLPSNDPADPTNSQAMSWSDPVKIDVAKPTFTVVGRSDQKSGAGSPKTKTAPKQKSTGSSTAVVGTRRWSAAGFSIALPKTWQPVNNQDSLSLLTLADSKATGGFKTNANVLVASGRNNRSYDQWVQDLAAQAKYIASGPVSTRVLAEPAGKTVWLAYRATTKSGKVLSFQQFVFDGTGSGYVVTFTTLPSLEKKYAATFAKAATSFKLG
jgi:hypothetical protein